MGASDLRQNGLLLVRQRGSWRRSALRRARIGFLALESSGQLHRVEVAQLRRQRRQGHLAEAPLVITCSEVDQPAPGRRQGRQCVECGDHRALFDPGRHWRFGWIPDHAQDFALAQGHADQCAWRERGLTPIAQRCAQPAVGRRCDDDGQAVGHRSDQS